MKKIIKKVLLLLLLLLVAVQVPFIYRRYRIGQLAGKIDQLNLQRSAPPETAFTEYKGVVHVHTNLGGHSTGGFDELITAANNADLDFVIMTEHYTDLYDTSALTLNGLYGKTLFIGGNEIDTADGDRFLMIPGSPEAALMRSLPTNAVLEKLHSENRVAIVTYPEKFKSWESNFDGSEVFSLHTQAKQMNPFTAVFDLIWSFPSYPALTLTTYFRRPAGNLQKFDEIAANRRITMSAGTDAHSNIGFHIFGDDAGSKLINIKIDPYETMFRVTRLHVFLDKNVPLTPEDLISALKSGHSFIGFDALGDSSGFSFTAEAAGRSTLVGNEIPLADGLRLRASAPAEARFIIFRNGERFFESVQVREIAVDVAETGTYRIEAYLDQLGTPLDKMPWIISNPIYVR